MPVKVLRYNMRFCIGGLSYISGMTAQELNVLPTHIISNFSENVDIQINSTTVDLGDATDAIDKATLLTASALVGGMLLVRMCLFLTQTAVTCKTPAKQSRSPGWFRRGNHRCMARYVRYIQIYTNSLVELYTRMASALMNSEFSRKTTQSHQLPISQSHI